MATKILDLTECYHAVLVPCSWYHASFLALGTILLDGESKTTEKLQMCSTICRKGDSANIQCDIHLNICTGQHPLPRQWQRT